MGSKPLANVGMAVAHDHGSDEAHGVHPRSKSEPARRLALQTLHFAFGDTATPYLPPLPSTFATYSLGERVRLRSKGAFQQQYPNASKTILRTRSVTVELDLDHADNAMLVDSVECQNQYKGLCCNGGSPVMGRVCTTNNVTACAIDADGDLVVNAVMTVQDGILRAVADLAEGAEPKWVEYAVTDFPQCTVVNAAGISMGPFGPIPIVPHN